MIPIINHDIDTLYDKVIKPCRQGKFLFLVYSKRSIKMEIKGVFKKFKIPFKRGIYSWKGIIIVASEIKPEFETYFDKIYKVV